MADQDPYGAIKFGEFRKYMQNKQSKLKEQESILGNQGELVSFLSYKVFPFMSMATRILPKVNCDVLLSSMAVTTNII
ncbi:unnamed protein product [Absidia cylindrospora]